ncbi:MAG: hypothetical protein ABGX43_02095, partial [Nitrospinaceae bacterium]
IRPSGRPISGQRTIVVGYSCMQRYRLVSTSAPGYKNKSANRLTKSNETTTKKDAVNFDSKLN